MENDMKNTKRCPKCQSADVVRFVGEWLKNGCDKSVEEISEIIKICIYGLKREQ
jgi:ribosomal protein L37AE/L43A